MTHLLLCSAEVGLTVTEAVERMQYVKRRSYSCIIMDNGGMLAVAKNGWARDLNDGSQLVPSTFYARGSCPRKPGDPMSEKLFWGTAGEVGAERPEIKLPLCSDPTTLYCAATFMGPIVTGMEYESEVSVLTAACPKTKAGMLPGQALSFNAQAAPTKHIQWDCAIIMMIDRLITPYLVGFHWAQIFRKERKDAFCLFFVYF